jgi:hypothetical protein
LNPQKTSSASSSLTMLYTEIMVDEKSIVSAILNTSNVLVCDSKSESC